MTLEFKVSESPNVGIELELQLLNAKTLDLADGILSLMELYPDRQSVKPEFIQSSVEVTTSACADTTEASLELKNTIAELAARCDELGMRLCGGGTH